jgi:hypothetical protein
MSELGETLERIVERIAFHESETFRLKKLYNDVAGIEGREPGYTDLGTAAATPGTAATTHRWKTGDFVGKKMATATTMVLKARSHGHVIKFPDLHAQLAAGTFEFAISGKEKQIQALRNSLGKNSTTFKRFPETDEIGLAEWYDKPERKPRRRATTNGNGVGVSQASESAIDAQAATAQPQPPPQPTE